MSPWLLPDYIADVLPPEARHIEELRTRLLDTARGYGYELVIPPLVEHLESLLTGTGEALGLQTFKLVDQLSGRTLGVRADTTPQVARIDTHFLRRPGVTRLCYCGPVLHTRPERAQATRELLQLGAEIYGEKGRRADLEVLKLALDCLRAAGVTECVVDLADARIVSALLAEVDPGEVRRAAIHRALVVKDAVALHAACTGLGKSIVEHLMALVDLYGGAEVLDAARKKLGEVAGVSVALDDLQWLSRHLGGGGIRVTFDLADARGWDYYTGPRFAVYAAGVGNALLRGGRYDGVGAAFGGQQDGGRPAAGFTLDLKYLAGVLRPTPRRAAIRAPWADAPALNDAIAALRRRGETVVRMDADEVRGAGEYDFDRELVGSGAHWDVVALEPAT
ncbi:MAG: ATP phosphoribosyltransferase regulatory subunit [Burkholderiaceae bacterium]|jgi:ATP phosphoribosyltransferase regulatory subunit|nr:MAG: ATP phosphoribosyltransferase regulatory subunit [Burkholderiaceae bacterium]